MSTFTIYTDMWVIQKAKVGDRVLYQGPNQMDQTWYRIIETNGERSLYPIIVSYDEY